MNPLQWRISRAGPSADPPLGDIALFNRIADTPGRAFGLLARYADP
jgi:hypothetical protein